MRDCLFLLKTNQKIISCKTCDLVSDELKFHYFVVIGTPEAGNILSICSIVG